jgi:general secretion pathway protein C
MVRPVADAYVRARGEEALNDNRRMPARVSSFVTWTVVALCASFWTLRLMASPPVAPAYTVPVAPSLPERADLSRLFGAPGVATTATAQPAASSRFRLLGIAAPKSGAAADGGVALIAVDGKPARPFRVGAPVDGDLVLVAVDHRKASLGPASGPGTVVLEMPPLPTAATGSLPAAPSMTGAAATPSPPANPTAPAAAQAAPSGPSPPAQEPPRLGRIPRTDAMTGSPTQPDGSR